MKIYQIDDQAMEWRELLSFQKIVYPEKKISSPTAQRPDALLMFACEIRNKLVALLLTEGVFPSLTIHELAVHPAYLKQYIHLAMIRYAEGVAKGKGLHFVEFRVLPKQMKKKRVNSYTSGYSTLKTPRGIIRLCKVMEPALET
jgi:hypothetical protein